VGEVKYLVSDKPEIGWSKGYIFHN
jgi:hypothetical protein